MRACWFVCFCKFFVVRNRHKDVLDTDVNENGNCLDKQRLVKRKVDKNTITQGKKRHDIECSLTLNVAMFERCTECHVLMVFQVTMVRSETGFMG